MVLDHRLDHYAASGPSVDSMLGNQVTASRDDEVSVLHHLQLFEAIGAVQPHAFADDLEDIDDSEWPIALMGAQFAMIGMIDGPKRPASTRWSRIATCDDYSSSGQ